MTTSIVIPMRDRPIAMLARTLDCLRHQTARHMHEVIVVGNGNASALGPLLRMFCAAHGVRFIEIDSGVWNKPLTSNVGIRAATGDYVMTMDIDILLAPNFMNAVYATAYTRSRFILCQVGELPDGVVFPKSLTPAGYTMLHRQAKFPAPTHGIGGIQHAPREFFEDIRGYDERMVYWGSMDSDMADRAVRYGLKKTWLNKATSMLHQPHVKKGRILGTQALKDAASRAHAENRRIRHSHKNIVKRNPDGWGEQS